MTNTFLIKDWIILMIIFGMLILAAVDKVDKVFFYMMMAMGLGYSFAGIDFKRRW